MNMTLNEYQERAMETCTEESRNPLYMLFGLHEETGEVAGKYAKLIRKGVIRFDANRCRLAQGSAMLSAAELDEITEGIKSELGDVAWMLAGLCTVLGYRLEDICRMNLDKLEDRRRRGVIVGEGDRR